MPKAIKTSAHFFITEYVTPEMFKKWGNRSINWIRPEVFRVDEFLRVRYDIPIIINNWYDGGDRHQSGLRYPYSSIGAGDSLHKFGVASDKQFEGMPDSFYDEVREDIIKNFTTLYKPLGLTTIEAETINWLHTDGRYIPNQKELNIVPIPAK